MTASADHTPVDEAAALAHGLSKDEYERILADLGRVPSCEELGVYSVMWSEHCSYKSSRVHLRRFPSSGKRVLQGPGENAGAVDIGGGMAAVFKIESHNHPSFVEPYQGAATGVGGILRDIFTMGARPVANMNSLHFGEIAHPRTPYLLSGVVRGVGDYGNCVGVATVGGEVCFDEGYNGNILVNAFTLGVVDQDRLFRAVASGSGNPVLYVGSKTGRDGIHGASLLASSEFREESEQMRPTVQVGDPFTENLLIEACLEVMSGDDVVAIQDMGAAGLTSSSVEMAARGGVGIRLDLDKVPLRDPSLSAYEMLLSESQERMVLVAKRGREDAVAAIFHRWGLACVPIGEVTDDGRFRAVHHGIEVVSIPSYSLTDGAPAYERRLAEPCRPHAELDIDELADTRDAGADLVALLSSPNFCSRAWIYEQYDSYVGADTLIHPGGDAGVVRVRENGAALAVTTDCNARYVKLDPFVGAQHAVAEAARNVAVVGARPLAISDCLNFGNPEKPEVMWQFSRAVDGISEACRRFDTPVISGNVSFYNETRGSSIPPTPVIAMVGLIEDSDHVARTHFENSGQIVCLLGGGRAELHGSAYVAELRKRNGGRPPRIDLDAEVALCRLCADLVADGRVTCAHDVSEGGLAIAVAEMCFASPGIGADLELEPCERLDRALFGESACRIVIAVDEDDLPSIESDARAAVVALRRVGRTGGNRLRIAIDGRPAPCIDIPVETLRGSWRDALADIASQRGQAA